MKKYIYTFITFLLLGVILIPMLPKEKEIITRTETEIIEKQEIVLENQFDLIADEDNFPYDNEYGRYVYSFENVNDYSVFWIIFEVYVPEASSFISLSYLAENKYSRNYYLGTFLGIDMIFSLSQFTDNNVYIVFPIVNIGYVYITVYGGWGF